MPEFETYVDVSVDEFLSACGSREIEKLIEALIEDGYLDQKSVKNQEHNPKSLMEEEWDMVIENLKEKRLNLSNEDEEIVKLISKKY